MLTGGAIVGHLAPPVVPAELWHSWGFDPLAWLMLLAALVLHTRGWRRSPIGRHPWRRRAFVAALVAAAVALVSPLDALSASLVSAHMVQHLVLTVVVAPLLVLSAPMATMLRGLPLSLRVDIGQLRRSTGLHPGRVVAAHPVVTAMVATVTLWCWHAAGPYELALHNDVVHRLEHAALLGTAIASWAAILLPARRRPGSVGTGVLVLFALSVQGSILGALLTFASEPWYPSYAGRTEAWGLTALEDQQLAGVIMWVPGGVTYLVAGLAATARWIARPPAMATASAAVRLSQRNR